MYEIIYILPACLREVISFLGADNPFSHLAALYEKISSALNLLSFDGVFTAVRTDDAARLTYYYSEFSTKVDSSIPMYVS
jgi:O-phosphoseryl-tRNA(Cys) synthetase